MASRAERRRAAALFLFAVLPRSLALDLSAVDARARGSFAVLEWSGQSPARRRACEPCANVASVGSGQTHPHSFPTMVFEELPIVATETTVPRGRVSSAGKLGCSCALCRCPASRTSARWRPQSWGAREVVKKAITKSLARTQLTAAKKKKVPPRSFAGPLQRQLPGLNLWPGQ